MVNSSVSPLRTTKSSSNIGHDPFVATPPHAPPILKPKRSFFEDDGATSTDNGMQQTRKTLEKYIRDTDKRIQEASTLGTSLLQSRKKLVAQLQNVSQQNNTENIGPDLQNKLIDIEREHAALSKETARAFSQASRPDADNASNGPMSPAVFSADARASPSKIAAPSRRQRNQPTSRIHDIEFATEISTSLLAQVRQLQGALAEKDEALRSESAQRSRLEMDVAALRQRMRVHDDSEQTFKNENWRLESQLQDASVAIKELTDKEQRLTLSLKNSETAHDNSQKAIQDLGVAHEKLLHDHATAKRSHDSHISELRKDISDNDNERADMQKRIDALNERNENLAKAIAARSLQPSRPDREATSSDDNGPSDSRDMSGYSPPASPSKAARSGVLELETLNSSLQHAHRMIQTLKNNIHRERTDKIELKRMLQDARDELDLRRGDGSSTSLAKKRGSNQDAKRKPARADQLGAVRRSREDIIMDDPEWEDNDSPNLIRSSVSSIGMARPSSAIHPPVFTPGEETSDAFETANERDTETEAFQTGNERMSEDDGDLTETDSPDKRSRHTSSLGRAGDRMSYRSTASISGDESRDLNTPTSSNFQQAQKYKIKLGQRGRPFNRHGKLFEQATPGAGSSPAFSNPSSTRSTPIAAPAQNLGAELAGLSDDDGSFDGTPSRTSIRSAYSTPDVSQAQEQRFTPVPTPSKVNLRRPVMVDASTMTEVVTEEKAKDSSSILGLVVSTTGGLAAGVIDPVTSRRARDDHATAASVQDVEPQPLDASDHEVEPESGHVDSVPAVALSYLISQHTALATDPSQLPRSSEQADLAVLDASPITGHVSAVAMPAQDEATYFKAQPTLALSGLQTQHTVPLAREPLQQPSMATSPVKSQSVAPVSRELPSSPALAVSGVRSLQVLPLHRPDPVYGASSITSQDVIPIPREPLAASSISSIISQTYEPMIPNAVLQALSFSGIVSQEMAPCVAGPSNMIAASDARQANVAFSTSVEEVPEPVDLSTLTGPMISSAEPGHWSVMPPPFTLFNGSARDNRPLSPVNQARETTSAQIRSPSKTKLTFGGMGGDFLSSGKTLDKEDSSSGGSSSQRDLPKSTATKSMTPYKANTSSPRKSDLSTLPATADVTHRPGSSGTVRGSLEMAPPLPADHNRKIAAATTQKSTGSTGLMGPPLMPASAYRLNQSPGTAHVRTGSLHGRSSTSRTRAASGSTVQKQPSISSFVSELDQRLNPAATFMYPSDVPPSTDPRMIQAITQTMIGEYLWKYTRKAGRSEMSSSRHRRFFWIHPYTRTLYWSEQDPSAAGKHQLKAKSVAIDAIRVVEDTNTYPPGLFQKSLVVVTPGRDVVFTAPTAQRHETWVNALSYLLLRTAPEQESQDTELSDAEIAEFNPQFPAPPRSASRATGRSRVSLSSYNSHTTARTTSPHRRQPLIGGTPTLGARHGQYTVDTISTPRSASPSKVDKERGSLSGRLSGFGELFRPSDSVRGRSGGVGGTISERLRSLSPTKRGAGAGSVLGRQSGDIYDAPLVHDDDNPAALRAAIEQDERDDAKLENVRACCDGKHDVGSLSRRHLPHNSFASRSGSGSRASRFTSVGGSHRHGTGHGYGQAPGHGYSQSVGDATILQREQAQIESLMSRHGKDGTGSVRSDN